MYLDARAYVCVCECVTYVRRICSAYISLPTQQWRTAYELDIGEYMEDRANTVYVTVTECIYTGFDFLSVPLSISGIDRRKIQGSRGQRTVYANTYFTGVYVTPVTRYHWTTARSAIDAVSYIALRTAKIMVIRTDGSRGRTKRKRITKLTDNTT